MSKDIDKKYIETASELRRIAGKTWPRISPDSLCENVYDAFNEIQRRKAAPQTQNAITSMEKSPYGGYVVFSVSAEDFANALIYEFDPPVPDYFGNSYLRRHEKWPMTP